MSEGALAEALAGPAPAVAPTDTANGRSENEFIFVPDPKAGAFTNEAGFLAMQKKFLASLPRPSVAADNFMEKEGMVTKLQRTIRNGSDAPKAKHGDMTEVYEKAIILRSSEIMVRPDGPAFERRKARRRRREEETERGARRKREEKKQREAKEMGEPPPDLGNDADGLPLDPDKREAELKARADAAAKPKHGVKRVEWNVVDNRFPHVDVEPVTRVNGLAEKRKVKRREKRRLDLKRAQESKGAAELGGADHLAEWRRGRLLADAEDHFGAWASEERSVVSDLESVSESLASTSLVASLTSGLRPFSRGQTPLGGFSRALDDDVSVASMGSLGSLTTVGTLEGGYEGAVVLPPLGEGSVAGSLEDDASIGSLGSLGDSLDAYLTQQDSAATEAEAAALGTVGAAASINHAVVARPEPLPKLTWRQSVGSRLSRTFGAVGAKTRAAAGAAAAAASTMNAAKLEQMAERAGASVVYAVAKAGEAPKELVANDMCLGAMEANLSMVKKCMKRAKLPVDCRSRGVTPLLAAFNAMLVHDGTRLKEADKLGLSGAVYFGPPATAAQRAIASRAAKQASEYESVVLFLLEQGADVNATEQNLSGDGWGLIHMAAAHNRVDKIEWLVERGCRIELPSRTGSTSLMVAAAKGHISAALEVMQRGAKISTLDKQDRAALHYAAGAGSVRMVKLLLKCGAQRDGLDVDGKTALDFARANGRNPAAQALMVFKPARLAPKVLLGEFSTTLLGKRLDGSGGGGGEVDDTPPNGADQSPAARRQQRRRARAATAPTAGGDRSDPFGLKPKKKGLLGYLFNKGR